MNSREEARRWKSFEAEKAILGRQKRQEEEIQEHLKVAEQIKKLKKLQVRLTAPLSLLVVTLVGGRSSSQQ